MVIVLMAMAILAPCLGVQAHEDGAACAGGGSGEGSGGQGHNSGSGGHDSDSTSGYRGGGAGGPGGSSGGHDDGTVSEDDDEEGDSGRGDENKGGVNTGGSGGGGSGGGTGKGGSGTAGGTITLVVTIEGFLDIEELLDKGYLPIDVTLFREGIPNTVSTVTDSEGVTTATFTSEASGDCFLESEDVPGYIKPEVLPITLTGDKKINIQTLEYVADDIEVTGVEINKSETTLIKGFTEQLDARVLPFNATEQGILWSSDYESESVATVNDYGWVTALSSGEATVIAAAYENVDITATCKVSVISVVYLEDPEPVAALRNQVVILPPEVTAVMDSGETTKLPVTWSNPDGNYDTVFQVPDVCQDCYVINLTGRVVGTDETASLTINVLDGIAVPVTGVSLNVNTFSTVVEATYQLIATIDPINATTPELLWSSSNESVATVEDGLVTGKAPGTAKITVQTVDGGYDAYCMVSVYTAPEEELIFPTLEGLHYPMTEFSVKDDVYINVEGLVAQSNFKEADYYVKVEQKGHNRLLGEGKVTISPTTVGFYLYEVTEFEFTSNYSNEYYMYMSKYPEYPKDDEQTLMTNFKIGSAVPTILPENIKVTLEITGGDRMKPGGAGGVFFLLCRELDKDSLNITWQDYLLDQNNSWLNEYGDSPEIKIGALRQYFLDEVKVYGVTDANDGVVQWAEPKETIKLGGYLLLEITPLGYEDNLNNINPYAHDPELLKEVHLTRNGEIVRLVENIFTGYGNGS